MSILVTAPPSLRCRSESNEQNTSSADFVHCGRLLAHDGNALSGHGTIVAADQLLASVSGLKVQYSQLYMVEPYKSKYFPKVGDVVVGRITSVQKARWKVDVNYRMSAILHLNNVNLPGGELRRKGLEDEVAMTEHLVVGDMVTAEVQQIKAKGQLQLHTRNLKYGKLGQGILVKTAATVLYNNRPLTRGSYRKIALAYANESKLYVFPSLVKPQKEYMHELFGVGVIIGCNGSIWISAGMSSDPDGGYSQDIISAIPMVKRLSMVRVAACIRLLAKNLICIYDISIIAAYKSSLSFKIKDLARPEISALLIPKVKQLIFDEEKQREKEAANEKVGRHTLV
ncbi:hypothetical protein ANCDUO_01123 [Ancylostoma duodenale]|uniref:S1 motif domain-containing protein n=1 Tax=Ancylostoma duodenale TaxID=51022 RepID=A0A0C2H3X9_9BILA|nr:hypothetical protein ANCDUO_01123 [Ancylostoma duodenale]